MPMEIEGHQHGIPSIVYLQDHEGCTIVSQEEDAQHPQPAGPSQDNTFWRPHLLLALTDLNNALSNRGFVGPRSCSHTMLESVAQLGHDLFTPGVLVPHGSACGGLE